jgi:xanthine dehydrogenase accessory factor
MFLTNVAGGWECAWDMREELATLADLADRGEPAAVALVARVYRSAPRQPGSAMVRSRSGRIAGSVTGGCVESDVLVHADEVIAGGPARLLHYGIVDDDAYAVGLPCGGEVDVFVEPVDPDLVRELAADVADERPVAYATVVEGPSVGSRRLVRPGDDDDEVARAAAPLLAAGETDLVEVGADTVLVHPLVPRADMYVFGAIDFASAVAEIGHFLGYRVTVCDPREAFLTPARFPHADALEPRWPHLFLEEAPVDARTVVCVLTHDERFDVPALKAALGTPAGYIGAMGSRRTTERRRERLREEGVTDEEMARIHAPIGLSLGSRTPQEVAVAVAAEIITTFRRGGVGAARAQL